MVAVPHAYIRSYGGNHHLRQIRFLECNLSLKQLIVITCLGSIYLLNYFESTFIRLTMALIATSLILDVIWLFMYATIYWSPPAIGDASAQLNAYRRFIIFFTICIIILKVPLGYILFQHRNPNI